MKVTILDTEPNEEEEIIIKCSLLDDDMLKLINYFKYGSRKLPAYQGGKMFFLEPQEVFYFESVEQKVFAYCRLEVYQVKNKLYELMEELPGRDFIRASKSTILNLTPLYNFYK